VNSTCTELVDKINEVLAQKVGQQRYKIWFKNSTRLIMEDNYVKVGVPNLFIGGWIENHFSEEIAAAVSEVTQQSVKIIFTIDPELFGSQRRRQLDSQAEFLAKTSNPNGRRHRAFPAGRDTQLRLKLQTFVVGSSNQLAYSAAQTIVAEPRTHFNPLFIHGGCGLGKTHLLQGICNSVSQKRPDTNFIYASGEEFTNQFILALKMGKLDGFASAIVRRTCWCWMMCIF